jgi:hypothetical protein
MPSEDSLIDFRYYQACYAGWPFTSEEKTCHFCGKMTALLTLDQVTHPELTIFERRTAAGCIDCLRAGVFEYWHLTRAGLVDEDGFTRVVTTNERVNSFAPSEELLTELRRTPPLPVGDLDGFEGGVWPICWSCVEVMTFLGQIHDWDTSHGAWCSLTESYRNCHVLGRQHFTFAMNLFRCGKCFDLRMQRIGNVPVIRLPDARD